MISRISIDTRSMQVGDTFVAIQGEKYDGHNFLSKAIEKGATNLIIDRNDIDISKIPEGINIIKVENCTEFLAQEARNRLLNLETQVIAITGSVGKTTTKNAIVAVLSNFFDVISPKGNLNTLLGVSITVLNEINKPNQKFVVEVGTYQRGNIAVFCKYIQPSVVVVTNVQPVHLERMGTIDNIAIAKGEIVEAVDANGTACLNWDDFRVKAMRSKCSGKIISYGVSLDADVKPSDIKVEIPLLGDYKVYTALAAYSVGHAFGLSGDEINLGLSNIKSEKGRLNKLKGKNNITVLDDSYNASLSSALDALKVLERDDSRRRVAILGDMLELGSEEDASHEDVILTALKIADILILVGDRMNTAYKKIKELQTKKAFIFSNYRLAIDQIGEIYQPVVGDLVLVKGSAGMRMEKLVEFLLAPDINPANVLVRQEQGWKSN